MISAGVPFWRFRSRSLEDNLCRSGILEMVGFDLPGMPLQEEHFGDFWIRFPGGGEGDNLCRTSNLEIFGLGPRVITFTPISFLEIFGSGPYGG